MHTQMHTQTKGTGGWWGRLGAWLRAQGGTGSADSAGCDRCRPRTETPDAATLTYPGLDQPTLIPDGADPTNLYALLMDLPFDTVLRIAAAAADPAPSGHPADLRRCA